MINYYQLHRQCGYSHYSSQIGAGKKSKIFKKIMTDFLEKLKNKRDVALDFLTHEKMEKATARDTTYVVDVLNKNISLAEGGSTSNIFLSVNIKTSEEAKKVIENSCVNSFENILFTQKFF